MFRTRQINTKVLIQMLPARFTVILTGEGCNARASVHDQGLRLLVAPYEHIRVEVLQVCTVTVEVCTLKMDMVHTPRCAFIIKNLFLQETQI